MIYMNCKHALPLEMTMEEHEMNKSRNLGNIVSFFNGKYSFGNITKPPHTHKSLFYWHHRR